MRVVAVGRVSKYEGRNPTYRATWVYRDFFQGTAGAVVNRYGERPYEPLPLLRNLRLMPPVFFADISLVVNDNVAKQLSQAKNVDLSPCVWEGIYDHPVDEAGVREMLRRFSPLLDDHGIWLQSQYRPPTNPESLPQYFEVIAPRLAKLQSQFVSTAKLELPSPMYETLEPLEVCAALFQEYPIVKATPYYLFTDAVFEAIREHVSDEELFVVRSFDIG